MSDIEQPATPEPEQPTVPDPGVPDPGVPEGTVVETKEGDEVVKERIVADRDDEGQVLGWHKEPVEGGE